jgi:hypothetical protein
MSAAAAMAAAADFVEKRGLTVTVGGEYQVVSQEYYRLVFDTVSTDIIETWSLDKDEIDDLVFKTNLGYSLHNPNNRFDLTGDLEFSRDRFLGRADGAYRLGTNEHNLKMVGTMESKAPLGDNEDWLDGYNYFLGYLKTVHEVWRRFELNGKVGFEAVVFTDDDFSGVVIDSDYVSGATFPSYDYTMVVGAAGGRLTFSDFGNDLAWEAVYRHRQVPDSSMADYDQYRLAMDYTYIGLTGYLSLYAGLEVKDYNRPEDEDDFIAWELNGLVSRRISDRIEGRLSFFTDIYRFDRPDVVNRNYWLFRGELRGGYQFSGIWVGPLIRLEIRRLDKEVSLPTDNLREDYDQWEVGLHAELLDSRRLYFLTEMTYGRREYSAGTELLTSYSLISPSIMASYSLSRRISVNLFFDGSFERHEETEDNTNLYLLSAGLSVRF